MLMQAPVELGPYSLEIWLSSESFWQWPCRHQLNWTPILLKCGSCRKPFWGWSCRLSTQIIHERAAVRKTATKRVLSGHIRISWQIMKSWKCTCDHEIWKSLSRYVIAQCVTLQHWKRLFGRPFNAYYLATEHTWNFHDYIEEKKKPLLRYWLKICVLTAASITVYICSSINHNSHSPFVCVHSHTKTTTT